MNDATKTPGSLETTTPTEEGTALKEHARLRSEKRERFDAIVIGGGQAGLAVGYQLAQRGLRFVILDASTRIGDSWRARWDSLRLFTPARFDALPGMTFPGPQDAFPTKDEMADYLERYAARFDLPVRSGVRVERLQRRGERYIVRAGGREFEALHVVVAMANYQRPRRPAFARELSPEITQLHSGEYRGPEQLRPGSVLLVGAGNSASEIAIEIASSHDVVMAGRDTGHIPFRPSGLLGRLVLVRLVLRLIFHRLLTVKTPLGRKARAKLLHGGGPLIRVKPRDLVAAGVERAGRVVGVREGLPVLDDGRVLRPKNVIWCTGFDHGFSWIDLPVFDEAGDPRHDSGVVSEEPGLYFVGLHFLHAMSSVMIHGVGRDAERIAGTLATRLSASGATRVGLDTPSRRGTGAHVAALR